MNKQKFTLNKVDDLNLWRELSESSEDYNIFFDTDYLELTDVRYDLYWIIKEDIIKAGYVVLLSEDGKNVIENDHIIYSGIFFVKNKVSREAKFNISKFNILEFYVLELTKKFKKISITLAPEIKDIRSFLWYNYNKNTNDKFYVENKFTSVLNIEELKLEKKYNEYDFFLNLQRSRKQEMNRALKEQYKILFNNDTTSLNKFYESTMIKQKENLSKNKTKIMQQIIEGMIEKKKGVMINLYDNNSNHLNSNFYIWDKRKAYHLYGASSPKNKSFWQGMISYWEIFNYFAKKHNIYKIDLEGLNSPNRGYFKQTLGGQLVQYFSLKRN